MKKSTETDLVRACLQLLAWSNVVAKAWRNNTGAVKYRDDRGAGRFVRFGERGSSDILAVLNGTGRILACECKQPKGRVTPDQQAFLAAVHDAGGVALVVRDPAELNAALTHLAADPHWSPRRA